MGPIMYGHNIVVRLHGFFCTLYTIIYVRFLYPGLYVGYMKSKNFQKCQNKAKIGQKSQNWPKWPKRLKKSKKAKKAKFAKKSQNYPKFGFFLSNFGFFGKFKLLWKILDFLEFFRFFGNFCIFWNKFAVCHFGGYIRTT
jgi:hypothetical protein